MVDSAIQKILLVGGILVLAVALRSFAHVALRKMALLVFFTASYLGAYFVFRNHLAGIAAAFAWFFLPWIELLTRIRNIRLPIEKRLESVPPPPPRRFPDLESLTEEIEEVGFEHVDDVGWEWDGLDQFFRIFYQADQRMLMSICLNEQREMSFVHRAITCRDQDGTIWRTWDYPYSHSLKSSPNLVLNQVEQNLSFHELMEHHESFLDSQGIDRAALVHEDPEGIHLVIEEEIRMQIDHNLNDGIIRETGEGTFQYSWRGLFYLWTQCLKDMIKLF